MYGSNIQWELTTVNPLCSYEYEQYRGNIGIIEGITTFSVKKPPLRTGLEGALLRGRVCVPWIKKRATEDGRISSAALEKEKTGLFYQVRVFVPATRSQCWTHKPSAKSTQNCLHLCEYLHSPIVSAGKRTA
jgi:hypothetical protein